MSDNYNSVWVDIDPDLFKHEERADELAHNFVGDYFISVMRHYELLVDYLSGTQGYECYAANREALVNRDIRKTADFYVGLQVWRTPEQCYEKIMAASTAQLRSFLRQFPLH